MNLKKNHYDLLWHQKIFALIIFNLIYEYIKQSIYPYLDEDFHDVLQYILKKKKLFDCLAGSNENELNDYGID